MAVRLLPDVEALLVAYLKAASAVTAIVGTRVSTELDDGFPRVNLTLVTGREIVATHLDEQQVQVDAYANDKATANLLARTVRAVLLAAAGVHSRGVVTGVRTITPPRWTPDDSVTPPRPRYLFEVGVTLHPNPLP